jgi:uncharacterized protein (TIGR02268 family)
MWNLQVSRSVLLCVLLASTAVARSREEAFVRTLLLSEHPEDATHRIYVKGRVVTVLRFEQRCDPAKIRLLGWEGRFEPVGVVGNKVILEPLRDLASDEAIYLLVTLADGTEVPFLLRPPEREKWAWTDQQVNVFKDRESYESMVSALKDALKENRGLREENERLRKEETSEDHALAALLVSGAMAQTPFTIVERILGKDEEAQIEAALLRGKGKAAAVFTVENLNPERSWRVQRVRLTTLSTGRERAAALRSSASEFAPGTSGVFAVVLDRSAFMDEGKLTNLFLEVYQHDGLRTAYVTLDHSLLGK